MKFNKYDDTDRQPDGRPKFTGHLPDREEDDNNQVDPNAREAVESLDGFREYMREQRGDNLTFGDY